MTLTPAPKQPSHHTSTVSNDGESHKRKHASQLSAVANTLLEEEGKRQNQGPHGNGAVLYDQRDPHS